MDELIAITNLVSSIPSRETGETIWWAITELVGLLVWFLGKFGLGFVCGLVLGLSCRALKRWLDAFEEAAERNGW